MNFKGFDAGTRNLVSAERNDKGEIVFSKEVNAFMEFPLENRFMANMLKKSEVKHFVKNNIAYVVGQNAVEMSHAIPEKQLKRPMRNGCVNSDEAESFFILSVMINSLVGEAKNDKDILYYTIPAKAVNFDTDLDLHQKVLDTIFKKNNINGKTYNAFPINEGLAVVFAELENKQYSGIGVSMGSGQVNVCYSIFSAPVFTFSMVNGGDWIDEQVAKATGMPVNLVNKEKETIDLTKEPTSLFERVVQLQYRILMEKTIAGISHGLQSKIKSVSKDKPVDIILAGGVATPNGFEKWFKEIMDEEKMPIEIGEIRKPVDNLFTVSKGALIAAENSVA